MKAMILAAGRGTRLRPLTDDRPKALVEVAGRTLLETAALRLRSAGVREIIINVHHFAEQVTAFLQSKKNFGLRIEVSREDELLDTGGGLKKAAHFFKGDGQPFFLHNVDVVSDIDLGEMLRYHVRQDALATLAVQQRESSRQLLFDQDSRLCGRRIGSMTAPAVVRPTAHVQASAFCGVHVISPRLLPMLSEQGAFSIIASYLRLAGAGEAIVAFRADDYYWRDLGTVAAVEAAARDSDHR